MATIANKPELLEFGTSEAYQVAIPPTDREHYITGVYALNASAPEGTTGDWHDVFHSQADSERPRTVTLGGSGDTDTNAIYGNLGVYEGCDRPLDKGLDLPANPTEVYLASHFRAVLDLLYWSLSRQGRVLNLTGATTDWLDTTEQQEFVLVQATRMADQFDADAQRALATWIEGERYRGSDGGTRRTIGPAIAGGRPANEVCWAPPLAGPPAAPCPDTPDHPSCHYRANEVNFPRSPNGELFRRGQKLIDRRVLEPHR